MRMIAQEERQSEFARVKESVSLTDFAQANLQRARAGHSYVCPFCQSGGHGTANSTSAFSIKGERFTCFSCNKGGDVFDLAAKVYGIDESDNRAKLEAVAGWAGIALDLPARKQQPARPRAEAPTAAASEAKPIEKKPTASYDEGRAEEKAFLLKAQADIENPAAVAYLAERGWTLDEAKALGMGYGKNAYGFTCLVLPWRGSDYYHIDRLLKPIGNLKYTKPLSDINPEKPSKAKPVGAQPLYNPAALDGEAFVAVEGVFDALSLESMGVPAVALGGLDADRLIDALKARESKPTAILCLDRDEPGREAEAKAVEKFESGGLPYRLVEWPDETCKDADELRKRDRAAAQAFFQAAYTAAVDERQAASDEAYSELMRASGIVSMSEVVTKLYAGEGLLPPVPTGLTFLDTALDGGLPVGLTLLAAASSTGKTTFLIQVADNVAATGKPVLFISLEQSAKELAAISVSRLMSKRGTPTTRADILNPAKRGSWDVDMWEAFKGAAEWYCENVSPYLCVYSGIERPGVKDVEAIARNIKKRCGVAPVVCIDYLQMLRAENDRDADKTTVDKHMTALRRLSARLETPVICISSLNRESYDTDISTTALKESGSCEYGADLILAMQTEGIHEAAADKTNTDTLKARIRQLREENEGRAIRRLELRMLKNRNGARWQRAVPFVIDVAHGEVRQLP